METIVKLSAEIEIFCNKIDELREVFESKFMKYKKDPEAEKKILWQSEEIKELMGDIYKLFLKLAKEILKKEAVPDITRMIKGRFKDICSYYKLYIAFWREVCKKRMDLSLGVSGDLTNKAVAWYYFWPEMLSGVYHMLDVVSIQRNLNLNKEEIQRLQEQKDVMINWLLEGKKRFPQ